MTTIQETFIALISIWAIKFQSQPEETIKALCNTIVPIKICSEIYRTLTSDNAIKKLEDLNEDERKEYLDLKPIIDNATNPDKLTCYKGVYTIKFLSKNI